MGVFKKLLAFLGVSGQKVNLLVVGLDNSGKTTIIERLKPKNKQAQEVAPTVGFSVDEFQRGYRSLWEQYYKEAHAIIFVVDSADKLRLVVVKDELDNLLSQTAFQKVPVLFFANKKDLPTALSPAEIAQVLKLEEIRDRPWNIIPSNALSGENLDKGTDWLTEVISR